MMGYDIARPDQTQDSHARSSPDVRIAMPSDEDETALPQKNPNPFATQSTRDVYIDMPPDEGMRLLLRDINQQSSQYVQIDMPSDEEILQDLNQLVFKPATSEMQYGALIKIITRVAEKILYRTLGMVVDSSGLEGVGVIVSLRAELRGIYRQVDTPLLDKIQAISKAVSSLPTGKDDSILAQLQGWLKLSSEALGLMHAGYSGELTLLRSRKGLNTLSRAFDDPAVVQVFPAGYVERIRQTLRLCEQFLHELSVKDVLPEGTSLETYLDLLNSSPLLEELLPAELKWVLEVSKEVGRIGKVFKTLDRLSPDASPLEWAEWLLRLLAEGELGKLLSTHLTSSLEPVFAALKQAVWTIDLFKTFPRNASKVEVLIWIATRLVNAPVAVAMLPESVVTGMQKDFDNLGSVSSFVAPPAGTIMARLRWLNSVLSDSASRELAKKYLPEQLSVMLSGLDTWVQALGFADTSIQAFPAEGAFTLKARWAVDFLGNTKSRTILEDLLPASVMAPLSYFLAPIAQATSQILEGLSAYPEDESLFAKLGWGGELLATENVGALLSLFLPATIVGSLTTPFALMRQGRTFPASAPLMSQAQWVMELFEIEKNRQFLASSMPQAVIDRAKQTLEWMPLTLKAVSAYQDLPSDASRLQQTRQLGGAIFGLIKQEITQRPEILLKALRVNPKLWIVLTAMTMYLDMPEGLSKTDAFKWSAYRLWTEFAASTGITYWKWIRPIWSSIKSGYELWKAWSEPGKAENVLQEATDLLKLDLKMGEVTISPSMTWLLDLMPLIPVMFEVKRHYGSQPEAASSLHKLNNIFEHLSTSNSPRLQELAQQLESYAVNRVAGLVDNATTRTATHLAGIFAAGPRPAAAAAIAVGNSPGSYALDPVYLEGLELSADQEQVSSKFTQAATHSVKWGAGSISPVAAANSEAENADASAETVDADITGTASKYLFFEEDVEDFNLILSKEDEIFLEQINNSASTFEIGAGLGLGAWWMLTLFTAWRIKKNIDADQRAHNVPPVHYRHVPEDDSSNNIEGDQVERMIGSNDEEQQITIPSNEGNERLPLKFDENVESNGSQTSRITGSSAKKYWLPLTMAALGSVATPLYFANKKWLKSDSPGFKDLTLEEAKSIKESVGLIDDAESADLRFDEKPSAHIRVRREAIGGEIVRGEEITNSEEEVTNSEEESSIPISNTDVRNIFLYEKYSNEIQAVLKEKIRDAFSDKNSINYTTLLIYLDKVLSVLVAENYDPEKGSSAMEFLMAKEEVVGKLRKIKSLRAINYLVDGRVTDWSATDINPTESILRMYNESFSLEKIDEDVFVESFNSYIADGGTLAEFTHLKEQKVKTLKIIEDLNKDIDIWQNEINVKKGRMDEIEEIPNFQAVYAGYYLPKAGEDISTVNNAAEEYEKYEMEIYNMNKKIDIALGKIATENKAVEEVDSKIANIQQKINEINIYRKGISLAEDFFEHRVDNTSDNFSSIYADSLIYHGWKQIEIRYKVEGQYSANELTGLKERETAKHYSKILLRLYGVRAGILSKFDFSALSTIEKKNDYRDIIAAQIQAVRFYLNLGGTNTENMTEESLLNAHQQWITADSTTQLNVYLATAMIYESIKKPSPRLYNPVEILRFYEKERAVLFNKIFKPKKEKPDGFVSFTDFKESTEFSSQADYTNQFNDYIDKYSDYESQVLSGVLISELPLTPLQLMSRPKKARQFRLEMKDTKGEFANWDHPTGAGVGYSPSPGRIGFIQLQSNDWLIVSGIDGEVKAEIFPSAQMDSHESLREIKNDQLGRIEILGDGKYTTNALSGPRLARDFVIPYWGSIKDSPVSRRHSSYTALVAKDGEREVPVNGLRLIDVVSQIMKSSLNDVAAALKGSLYKPSGIQQLAEQFVPFYKTIYHKTTDSKYEVDVEDVIMDAIAVALILLPTGIKLFKLAGQQRQQIKALIAKQRELGLRGEALAKAVMAKLPSIGLVTAEQAGRILASATYNLFEPIPLKDMTKFLYKKSLNGVVNNLPYQFTDMNMNSLANKTPIRKLNTTWRVNDVDLSGKNPETTGKYKGVYTITPENPPSQGYQDHYIKSDDGVYKVLWDEDRRTWCAIDPARPQFRYSERVKLKETGQWGINFEPVGLLGGAPGWGRNVPDDISIQQKFLDKPANRIAAEDKTFLNDADRRSYGRDISKGFYDNNLIRHNFVYGGGSLPRTVPDSGASQIQKTTAAKSSGELVAHYLQAVENLDNYPTGKTLTRGVTIPLEKGYLLKKGTKLQNHQIAFFSDSDLVARSYADAGENKLNILYRIKNPPAEVFKKGVKDMDLYTQLASDLRKKGVQDSDLRKVVKADEIIVLPGHVFEIADVKEIRSNIHKDKIIQVDLTYKEFSENVYNTSLAGESAKVTNAVESLWKMGASSASATTSENIAAFKTLLEKDNELKNLIKSPKENCLRAATRLGALLKGENPKLLELAGKYATTGGEEIKWEFLKNLVQNDNTAINFRAINFWLTASDRNPMNHFVVVVKTGGATYVLDPTAAQFSKYRLNGPLFELEENWVKKYQDEVKFDLIKYKDFPGISEASRYANFANTSPHRYIEGAYLINSPDWYARNMPDRPYLTFNTSSVDPINPPMPPHSLPPGALPPPPPPPPISAILPPKQKKPTRPIEFKPGDKEEAFSVLESKGKTLYEQHADKPAASPSTMGGFDNRYSVAMTEAPGPSNVAHLAPGDMHNMKIKVKDAKNPAYDLYISKDGESIVTSSSYKADDITKDPLLGKPLSYSEIMFNSLKKSGIDLKKLNRSIQASIQNEVTQDVINAIGTPIQRGQVISVSPTENPRAFYTLLGTDNCKATLFMLNQHVDEFSNKTVTSIDFKGSGYLVMNIG